MEEGGALAERVALRSDALGLRKNSARSRRCRGGRLFGFGHGLCWNARQIQVDESNDNANTTRASKRLRLSSSWFVLVDALLRDEVQLINGLKIEDVEGIAIVVLAPSFRDAPQELWSRLLTIEDTNNMWQVALLSELSTLGYSVAARTRLNVRLRRDRAGINR